MSILKKINIDFWWEISQQYVSHWQYLQISHFTGFGCNHSNQVIGIVVHKHAKRAVFIKRTNFW